MLDDATPYRRLKVPESSPELPGLQLTERLGVSCDGQEDLERETDQVKRNVRAEDLDALKSQG